jgi:hypothetical protein
MDLQQLLEVEDASNASKSPLAFFIQAQWSLM